MNEKNLIRAYFEVYSEYVFLLNSLSTEIAKIKICNQAISDHVKDFPALRKKVSSLFSDLLSFSDDVEEKEKEYNSHDVALLLVTISEKDLETLKEEHSSAYTLLSGLQEKKKSVVEDLTTDFIFLSSFPDTDGKEHEKLNDIKTLLNIMT
jgi:hypothetical protein